MKSWIGLLVFIFVIELFFYSPEGIQEKWMYNISMWLIMILISGLFVFDRLMSR